MKKCLSTVVVGLICHISATISGFAQPCLQLQCPTNKVVQCGSAWTFDLPTASTCCTNGIVTSTGTLTNLITVPTGLVTNGACPRQDITQSWTVIDGCGNSTNCSQTSDSSGMLPAPCLTVQCPTNKTVQCGTAWTFDQPVVSTCCNSNIAGTKTNILIIPSGFVTNGVCPQLTVTENWAIMDGCGDSTPSSSPSRTTVLGCCPSNCLQVQCPNNKTVQCGSSLEF